MSVGAGGEAVVVATRNPHKLEELGEILAGFELEPLPESVVLPPEDGETFTDNALIKARAAQAATGRAAISDESAVAIATPADGPSLGTAPAGTWMWMSWVANQSSGRSATSCEALPRTQESAAWADSRITSPSWPVIVSRPEPGIAVASTKSTSPLTGVHASPVATPGSRVRRRVSTKKRWRPSSSRTRGSVTETLEASVPSAACRAILRHAAPISRSRPRTPASRV